MKRLLAILLIALFCLSLLAGCGTKKKEAKEDTPVEQTAPQTAPDTTQPPAADTTQPSGK
jgi:PBP1b-binding outer membrane lipoprotein LpoB